jgi:uncharacterized protein YkwD
MPKKISRAFIKLLMIASAVATTNSQNFAYASNWSEQMLTSVNNLRSEKGLKPVTLCRSLSIAAQKYANEMASGNFLSHRGSDGSSPGDRMQKSGYKWRDTLTGSMIAENIAGGQATVAEVMKGWKKSKSHYKNIIEKRFEHVGFGFTTDTSSKYKHYWVQNFGFGAKC